MRHGNPRGLRIMKSRCRAYYPPDEKTFSARRSAGRSLPKHYRIAADSAATVSFLRRKSHCRIYNNILDKLPGVRRVAIGEIRQR